MLAPDALLMSDGRRAYGAFAEDASMPATCTLRSTRVPANVPSEGDRRHYLPRYLGWRRMIEREGDALLPDDFIAHALPQISN